MAEYQVVDKEVLDTDLKSIGDSIRAKGGTAELFNSAKEMKDAVDAIQTGDKAPVIQPLEVTENGEYTAPPGVDGYSPVNVNVPSGGGDATMEDGLIDHSITAYRNDRITYIKSDVFRGWKEIKLIEIPNLKEIKTANCFNGCGVEIANYPMLSRGKGNDFRFCQNLRVAVALGEDSVPTYLDCPLLAKVTIGRDDLDISPNLKGRFSQYCFENDISLITLILRSRIGLFKLPASNVFAKTPIEGGTGYIYVPKALVGQYKAATNWITFAAQIRAIEDYPDIIGG